MAPRNPTKQFYTLLVKRQANKRLSTQYESFQLGQTHVPLTEKVWMSCGYRVAAVALVSQ